MRYNLSTLLHIYSMALLMLFGVGGAILGAAPGSTVQLSNGVVMPTLQLGTPSCRAGDGKCVLSTADAVALALSKSVGMVGVDTGQRPIVHIPH